VIPVLERESVIPSFASSARAVDAGKIPEPAPVPLLSESARELLLEASQDRNGMIMSLGTVGGRIIQTNNRGFVEPGNPRSEALWKGAIEELAHLGHIKDQNYKGEAFSVTDSGYHVADDLRKQ
jgi:hypothetical protein